MFGDVVWGAPAVLRWARLSLALTKPQRDQHLFFFSQFLRRQPGLKCFLPGYRSPVYGQEISVELATRLLFVGLRP